MRSLERFACWKAQAAPIGWQIQSELRTPIIHTVTNAPRKAGNFVTRRIAGETIVVPIRARAAELDSVYVLNEVGAAIWNQLDEGRSVAAITATIAEAFDVSPETAQRDVEQFLEKLIEAGVVEGRSS